MLEFSPLTKANLNLLNQLLDNLGAANVTFRYFDKRPADIVLTHLYAVVLLKNHIPVAYGHLEREGSHLWLGVAVAEVHQGNGYGKQMVHHLIDFAKEQGEPSLTLTVDKVNYKAVKLYESLGFICKFEKAHYYQYNYSLT